MATNEQDGADEGHAPRNPGQTGAASVPGAPAEARPRDAQPTDVRPTDRQLSDRQLSDAVLGDERLSDREPSDAVLGDERLFDREPSETAPSDEELSGAAPSDEELSGAAPNDRQPSGAAPSDVTPRDAKPSDAIPSDADPSDAEPSDAAAVEPADAVPADSGATDFVLAEPGARRQPPAPRGTPAPPALAGSGAPAGASAPSASPFSAGSSEPAPAFSSAAPPAPTGAPVPPLPPAPAVPPARPAEPYAPAQPYAPAGAPLPPVPPGTSGPGAVPASPYGPVEYLSSTPLTADGRPVVSAGPADVVRAVAVGLLNLSGLGLGYALLRRWAGLALCLVATAALLVVALPADPDGVSGKVVAAYAAFLGLAAVHGGLRGLRRPLRWPPKSPVAAVLGLVLLAVPVGGVVLYRGAQDDATQKMLLDRLHTADHLVQVSRTQPFDSVRSDYGKALDTYRDLYEHHAGSRAAKRVPASLTTYYTAIGAAYEQKKYCDAVEPLQYLRTVPAHFDRKALGPLTGWPDDRLATSLYECGAQSLGQSPSSPTAETDFTQLLTTFPTSPQAAKVEPAYRAAIDKAASGLDGGDPCAATDTIRDLDGSVSGLPGRKAGAAGAFTEDARRADGYVESGTYACGVHQYKGGDFGTALTTIDGFVTRYPHDSHVALAKKIAIAAEIAQHDPDAGKHLPTLDSGGSIPVTFTNDSPDAVQVLYTGPVTGSITIRGCSGCSVYGTEADAGLHACKSSGKDYGKKTLYLPAGTTYFLNKPVGISSTTPASHTSTLRNDYEYTECAYTVKRGYGL